ncbi:MAG: hypothetical protein VKI42_01095 [Synechococcaceae cyanobacterium]|nr:hypothetical protein [Synechococcaceae cyanobacterium]
MSQELRRVNGRWVSSGQRRSSDLVPMVSPAAARPQSAAARPVGARARLRGRPVVWAGPGYGWQSPESFRRIQRTGALQPSLFRRIRNELQWGLKQIGEMNAGTVPTGTVPPLMASPGAMFPPTQYRDRNNRLRFSTPLERQVAAAATVGVIDNAGRAGYSLWQRHVGRARRADPTAGGFGSGLQAFTEGAYRLLDAKPPSQQSEFELGLDGMTRSFSLNAVLTAAPLGLLTRGATTVAGMAVRGGAAFALGEVLSNYLDDNTSGNIVNLINGVTGASLPGAVDVGRDDWIDSGNKSLLPNALAGFAVGGAFGLTAGAFRSIGRRLRGARQIELQTRARVKQESAGLIEAGEDGGFRFTDEAMEPPPAAAQPPAAAAPEGAAAPAASPMDEFRAANAEMEQRLGGETEPPTPAAAPDAPAAAPAREIPTIEDAGVEDFGRADPGELPQADPAIDPWDIEYDPALPESDSLLRAIEEMSDTELAAARQSTGMPVVERINQTLESRGQMEPAPGMNAGMVMAPTDRLAEDYLAAMSRKLGAREDFELRPLFDPQANPQLWQRAQALTGAEDPGQLTRADMVETFELMAAEGQAPIVNRLMGAQMLPTGDIQAAPRVFQYKGGVNEAGEQLGNSLDGVERWDPNAENLIQVWRDTNGEIGQAGAIYVVNGHNRLAAAQRMGIPSMRVEYLDAPTAAEARLQGAIANVSDGKGTVWDAARLARDYGITDPAQLTALGKPGASGFWREGMALGRLPEDVFLAALNEQIPLRRAVIIGESGVDEETMRSAYRYLVQQGPESVREGTLRELLAMAGRSPATSSADQPDLLSGTEWGQSFNEGLLAKADLAAAVRQMLSKERKLFGTVGRQAGQIGRVGQVDAAAAKGISGEASRALSIFDLLKYEVGPVGDLLNEGTARVLAGESPAVVAGQIKNRLAAAISEAMGKEVGTVTDVVQEDIFARAAGVEPEAPAAPRPDMELDERATAEMDLLREAIANGEVRPPSTPIPELPEPPQVRLDEVAVDPRQGTPAPGSKAAQAMADELRLAVDYARADAADAWDQETALRDSFGYEERTFAEKADLGMLDGLDEVMPTEVMPREDSTSIAGTLRQLMRRMAESDARLFRTIGELQQTTRRAVDELGGMAPPPVRPEPLRLTEGAQQPELQLPLAMRSTTARYGRATVQFASDLDRAAYVLANDAVRPSKGAVKFRRVVEEAGLSVDDVIAHGKRVKAVLKEAAKGGVAQIQLPAQPWRRSGSQSIALGRPPRSELTPDARRRLEEKLIGRLNDVEEAKRLIVEARLPDLVDAFRRVAGEEVKLRIEDTYKVGKATAAWGGDGLDEGSILGLFQLEEDTITIWRKMRGGDGIPDENLLPEELSVNMFHEAFHRIVRVTMPDRDLAVLNTSMARLKAAKAMEDWGSARSDIAYDELLTEAAARVIDARQRGIDPIEAIMPRVLDINPRALDGPAKAVYDAVVFVVKAINKVFDAAERAINALQGRGFESISSVLQRASSGEMTNRLYGPYDDFWTFDERTRLLKASFWEDYNVFGRPITNPRIAESKVAGRFNQEFFDEITDPADLFRARFSQADSQRVRQEIRANNEAMAEIRRKAATEGC